MSGDLSRIATNIQSIQAYNSLNRTNANLSTRQLRLASGSRINRAEDDSAGYSIAKKLEARVRGQAQAIANVGDAKSMLTVAEGGLNTTMDILQTMKEKVVQAANDTMGAKERAAIRSQLSALQKEVEDIFSQSTFNGENLFTKGAETDFTFQVNAESGDTFDVSIGEMSSEDLGLVAASGTRSAKIAASTSRLDALTNSTITLGATADTTTDQLFDIEITEVVNDGATQTVSVSVNGTETADIAIASGTVTLATDITFGFDEAAIEDYAVGQHIYVAIDALELNVRDNGEANTTLRAIDSAIAKVSDELANLGDAQSRLTFKQSNLTTSMTNNEAARSQIVDADFAKEQMEIVKLQILQQTGTAALAQANAAPQAILSLF